MRVIYSRLYILAQMTLVKCLNPTVCVCLCVKPPEPKYTFGPTERKKNTLTFSAQTHGLSIFPEVFETFLRFSTWKWGDPTHRQINSCTCLPARAVATSSVSSYSTKNCMQSAKKRDRTGHCRAPPRFLAHIRDAGELTVVTVEFGVVDPVAPRLSQHYFWTRQWSPLRNSRHCCGAFSPLDLLLLQLLPGRSALLPPDVILGPFRHSFRYNVTTQESALVAIGIGGLFHWLTRANACCFTAPAPQKKKLCVATWQATSTKHIYNIWHKLTWMAVYLKVSG